MKIALRFVICLALGAVLAPGLATGQDDLDSILDTLAPVDDGWAAEPVLLPPSRPDPYGAGACNACTPSRCDTCRCRSCCCGRCCSLEAFLAADSWRGPIDDRFANNFGIRTGVNYARLLAGNWGLQAGAAYGVYDLHGRGSLDEQPEPSSVEDQTFVTLGGFRRGSACSCCWLDRISAGVVYDFAFYDNVGPESDGLTLGQIRTRLGYIVNDCVEIGVWASADVDSQTLTRSGRRVRSLEQLNIFWRRLWNWGTETTCWVGIPESPGEVTFGASGQAPLTDHVAMFGSFQYILPSSNGGVGQNVHTAGFEEEYWNVTFGFTWYYGASAKTSSVAGQAWMPLLPVANNSSFVLETR